MVRTRRGGREVRALRVAMVRSEVDCLIDVNA